MGLGHSPRMVKTPRTAGGGQSEKYPEYKAEHTKRQEKGRGGWGATFFQEEVRRHHTHSRERWDLGNMVMGSGTTASK